MKPEVTELKIFKCNNGWAVRHGEKVLCQLIKTDSGIDHEPFPVKIITVKIAYPVVWKTYSACEEWISEGCIADIQEAHQNLAIRFTDKQLIMPKED